MVYIDICGIVCVCLDLRLSLISAGLERGRKSRRGRPR
jgi:hypothetical protein